MSKEFNLYLKSLQQRAQDIGVSLAKLDLRQQAPNWPALLKRFASLSMQVQLLFEELYNQTPTGDIANERRTLSHSLFVPTVHNYDPARTLRTKPIIEIESEDVERKSEFLGDSDLSALSPKELEVRLNDFNKQCLALRLLFEAMAAPVQAETAALGSLALAAEPRELAAAGACAGTFGSGSAMALGTDALTATARARRDSEDTLQATLQTILTGRLLRER